MLAQALGRTVEELLETVSYEELVEWYEFNSISPIGDWRADVRSAQICAVLANINRDPKKREKPFEIAEWMPFDKIVDKQKEPKGVISPETIQWFLAQSRKKSA